VARLGVCDLLSPLPFASLPPAAGFLSAALAPPLAPFLFFPSVSEVSVRLALSVPPVSAFDPPPVPPPFPLSFALPAFPRDPGLPLAPFVSDFLYSMSASRRSRSCLSASLITASRMAATSASVDSRSLSTTALHMLATSPFECCIPASISGVIRFRLKSTSASLAFRRATVSQASANFAVLTPSWVTKFNAHSSTACWRTMARSV
jgi:hypothetical protein